MIISSQKDKFKKLLLLVNEKEKVPHTGESIEIVPIQTKPESSTTVKQIFSTEQLIPILSTAEKPFALNC